MWCFLNCLVWTWSATFFSIMKSHLNCPCAWLSIGICFIILDFRRKYITEKDTTFSTNVCLLNAFWQTKWKSQKFWQLFSFHNIQRLFSNNLAHFKKVHKSHKSILLSSLTLTELHKRKIWPIFANKMLAEKRRGHMKTKNLYPTVWVCLLCLWWFPGLLSQWVKYEIVKDLLDNNDYVSTSPSTQKIHLSHVRDPWKYLGAEFAMYNNHKLLVLTGSLDNCDKKFKYIIGVVPDTCPI